VVTTAQIPGRPAPLLVTDDMVAAMRPGSVIVDMAAATGGNVAASRPDEVVVVGGVSIHGPTNLAAAHPADASRMYSRNLLALVDRIRTTGGDAVETGAPITVDLEDDVLGPTTVVAGGVARHARTVELLGARS
jgi:NAD(P) transhydrogenase subunit alpha